MIISNRQVHESLPKCHGGTAGLGQELGPSDLAFDLHTNLVIITRVGERDLFIF